MTWANEDFVNPGCVSARIEGCVPISRCIANQSIFVLCNEHVAGGIAELSNKDLCQLRSRRRSRGWEEPNQSDYGLRVSLFWLTDCDHEFTAERLLSGARDSRVACKALLGLEPRALLTSFDLRRAICKVRVPSDLTSFPVEFQERNLKASL